VTAKPKLTVSILRNLNLGDQQDYLSLGSKDERSQNPLPAIDLSGLDHEQRHVAETMLKEDCESFSSNEEDIVESLIWWR